MDAATRKVIDYFDQINQIPRCSKNEARVAQWLHNWAEERGFAVDADAIGNMVIRVPATPGMESAPVVIIQGHMDMVCEKAAGSDHDFASDPIRMVTEGDWLTAVETTLGADNGIAIAIALALVDAPDVARPPLELYFTVDEETGLTGVRQMDPGLIQGRILINLDSEDEGIFVVGCAGGRDTRIQRPMETRAPAEDEVQLDISVGGLTGGHSGVDIGKHRANAIQTMARLLTAGSQAAPLSLVTMAGGTGRNVIPRDCTARVVCPGDRLDALKDAIEQAAGGIRGEYVATDANMAVTVLPAGNERADAVVTASDTAVVLNLLMALPSGPREMSPDFPLLVQTSSNLALVDLGAGELAITVSQRSAVASRLALMADMVESVGRLSGATVVTGSGYPPWPVNRESALVTRCQALFRELFDAEPVVQLMHAGLECAVIGDRCSGMDMISLGPTLENPHSPSERLYLPSVPKVWRLLVALLASLGKEG